MRTSPVLSFGLIGLSLSLMLTALRSVGQNLVPDPGFENWNGTIGANPNTLGGLLLWDEANGTPDHHHQLNPPGSNLTSLQSCPLGAGQTQCGTPYAGQAVLGVYKGNGVAGTKEWATIALSGPMVPGQTYRVGYWIQNKKDNPNFIMETSQWGLFFGTSLMPPFNPDTYNFSAAPADWVTCSQMISDTTWQLLEWCFVPTQAYTHLYVGYVGDVVNATTNAWSTSGSVGFYAWVDEVFVEPITIGLTTSPDVSICTGDSTLIWASSPLTVSWDGGLTMDSAIWVSPTTTTTYYVETIGSGGCIVQDSVTVSVTNCNCTIDLQNTVLGVNDTGCPGPGNCNGTASAMPINGLAPYAFSWDDALAQSTTQAIGLCAGTYTCIVQDANGCADTVSVTITGPAFPVLSTVVVDESCQGAMDGAVDLTVNGGIGPFSYLWSTMASGQDITGLGGGSYSVAVTDGLGCVHADTAVVAAGTPVAPASIAPVTPFCVNDAPAVLSASPSGGAWSGTGVDPFTGVFDPGVGPGSYTVVYAIGGTCGSADSATVTVEAIPVVNFTASPTSGCVPLDVLFTPTTVQAGQVCAWDLGDGSTATQATPFTYSYTQSGSYDVALTLTSAAGCTASLVLADLITATPLPVVLFDVELPGGPYPQQTVLFRDGTSGSLIAWEWSFGDGTGDQGPNVEHVYSEPGTYPVMLTVTTDSGCVASATTMLEIQAETQVFMPNGFSPDGDGINELLRPELQGVALDHYELIVVDRWGRLLFNSIEPAQGWDGTYNNGGVPVPVGVYVWKLTARSTYSGERVDRSGHVVLLR